MELRKSVVFGICAVAVFGIGYAVYWDYLRQTDPEFRRKLKKSRKKAAKQKKAAVEESKSKTADFIRGAVEEVTKESFPTDVTAKEKFFMEQVAKGETLFAGGESGYHDAALCFYKALKVYPNPVELIMIYQKTIPEPVFNLVYEMMSVEVKKKQAEYFGNFPPKEMNVRIEEFSQSSTSDDYIRRVLISTKDFAPGDVIFTEQALASALDPSLENGEFCSHCLKELNGADFSDDSDLFGAVYCSKSCQEKAMAEYETLLFTTRDDDSYSNEAKLKELVKSGRVKYPLMIARFLAKMVHEETQKVATGVEEEYSTWDHIERLRFLAVQPSDKESKEITLLRELFKTKVPGMEEFISEERYLMLKGKLMYNAYGIYTEHNMGAIKENLEETMRSSQPTVIGAGFYRVASYIAHSCNPNTETRFPDNNNVLSIVATKPIKVGDELKISYIRVGDRNYSNRRSELETKWRFKCTCIKCMEEAGEVGRSA
ncbi:13017_t:CDS:2 [Funneliformis geosporum]|uniref:Mitochondrial import receptor subunit TOM20 n=1 Tax=Funneliformis geosporum TaxID=1117311 RepID=A0A9W4X2Q2_9GLOM|nr:15786_t:CDS:2 [Funneliformis geosporum]CAI2185266.1 13017_t:CDS:2 [Funneliformis geosporum]